MAGTLDTVIAEIRSIQHKARLQGVTERPAVADDYSAHAEGLDRAEEWWTASPSRIPGARTRCRSSELATKPEHLRQLEEWMKSYRAEELFDRTRKADSGAGRACAQRATEEWARIPMPMAACF